MKNIYQLDPAFGTTRIYRQVTFDDTTFDALMDIKRDLNEFHDDLLTNSETLRLIILSHPAADLKRA